MELDIKILGGLPITVEVEFQEHDNRDVGGGSIGDLSDWWIVDVAGFLDIDFSFFELHAGPLIEDAIVEALSD